MSERIIEAVDSLLGGDNVAFMRAINEELEERVNHVIDEVKPVVATSLFGMDRDDGSDDEEE